MELRKIVLILLGVMVLGFSIGIYSLVYNDNFRLSNLSELNLGRIDIGSGNSHVKVGIDGIEVRDGDDQVIVNWDGVKVTDGDSRVIVGPGEIKVEDGDSSSKNWGWSWFGLGNLSEETINEEKFEPISGVETIEISSPFVEVDVFTEDREDIRVKYSGRLKANVIPKLDIKRNGSRLNIKLETSSTSYTVTDSTARLQVFVPKVYEGNYEITTSSGDISIDDILARDLTISTSSGDLFLGLIKADTIDLSTSSGDIKSEEIYGDVKVRTSSGDVRFKINGSTGNYHVSTSSGDVDFNYASDSSYLGVINTSSGDVEYGGSGNLSTTSRNSYEFKLGGGEKNININTSSGDIKIVQR